MLRLDEQTSAQRECQGHAEYEARLMQMLLRDNAKKTSRMGLGGGGNYVRTLLQSSPCGLCRRLRFSSASSLLSSLNCT